jgi:DNA recombination protein RmuC
MENLLILIAPIVGVIVGFVIGKKSTPTGDAQKLSRLENENKILGQKNAVLENENRQMTEKLTAQFENISRRLLATQTEETTKLQKENLNIVISPFCEQMDKLKKDFEDRITLMNKNTTESKTSLEEQLKSLRDASGALQNQAVALTDALLGKKKAIGNLGEMQLERILEMNGLTEGIGYTKQEYFQDDAHRRFTDYVLKLPDDRDVVVDVKMSLNANFLDYYNADENTNKEAALTEFIKNTKSRIDELSGKEYQNLMKGRSLDYVFMFIPLEQAYLDALQKDPKLYDYAFSRNIAIATPSLILPMIRTIKNLWNVERQNKNIEKTVENVRKLYDKYVSFTENFAKVGRSLNTANESYTDALKQLSSGAGNMSVCFERIKTDSGIQTSKNIAIEFDGEGDTDGE